MPSTTTTAAAVLAFTALFFVAATYSLFGGVLFQASGIKALDILTQDSHYKYFFLFLIPTTSYFIIARWTGWQYFVSS